MALERLQKVLARAGISSRRKIEDLIVEGVVTINGKVAKLGDKADLEKDAVKVRGKLVQGVERKAYYAFHKPKGVISALGDPEGRASIENYLTDIRVRVYPVGRLDFMSEGIILLTNDGDLAEKIQKSPKLVRVYHVKVRGMPKAEELKRLEKATRIGHKWVGPSKVNLREEFAKKSLIEVVFEGSGAQDVKAFFESRRFLVDRIVRVQFGHLTLGDLAPGKLRALTESQVKAILDQPELGLRRVEQDAKTVDPAPTVRKVVPLPAVERKAPSRILARARDKREGSNVFRPKAPSVVSKPTAGGARVRRKPSFSR